MPPPKAPRLYIQVFEHLDTPRTLPLDAPAADLAAKSVPAEGLELLVAVHRAACRTPLPASALLGEWSNETVQLQLISHALSSGLGKHGVDWHAARRVVSAEEGGGTPSNSPPLSRAPRPRQPLYSATLLRHL